MSLFESVFNESPIGTYLLSPTPESTILAVNDSFLRTISRTREEVVGFDLFDVFREDTDDPNDTGIAALRASLKRVRETGEPHSLPAQRFPIRMTAPDGHAWYEERYWSAVNTPVFDESGKLVCILHNTIDITKQVHAEAALRKSEAKYRRLFESPIEGLCIVEVLFAPDGTPSDIRFRDVNPIFEEQTGLHDVVGKTMREVTPDIEQHWFDIYGAVARTGEPVRFVNETKALGRWFDVYACRSDEHNPNMVAVLFRDVTDQKKAEEELRKSEQLAREAARAAEDERHRLDAVLEATPVALFVADMHGGLIRENLANRRLWGEPHPNVTGVAEYQEWKGWWADGSPRHGKRLAAEEWTMARVLKGEEDTRDIIEIETFDDPPVRRTIINSGAQIRDRDGTIVGGVIAQMDITDRIRTEKSLRETAARLQFTLESAQIGDWDLDLATGKAHQSVRHARCFGYAVPDPDWGFEKFIAHVHPDDRPMIKAKVDAAVSCIKDLHFECRVIWPDGSLHWIVIHGSAHGVDGKATRLAGISYDITDRKLAEEKARHASLHDPLTGLPNRAMLFEYASHLLSHNRRTRQFTAVLFMDLDRFKPINDTHGHDMGDALLKEVAKRLSASIRAEDVVIRLGGDEFVILLQNVKNASYAADVTRHIVERINEPFHIGDLTLSVSTSVGISVFPGDGQDIDTLMSHADMAMYQAKQAGRNNFQFYSPEFAAGTKLQLAIEQQLRTALNTGAFHLYYQPVVNVETGELVSVEALLRWRNDDIGPERFVPVAEATGIINPIGRWILEEASRQHKVWKERGMPAIPIAVNVSVVEFRDKNFVDRFNRTIGEHGINADALQLEVTETAMMDDIDYAVTVLSQLKNLGVKVLLDDFGTGHSSLAYLARLPLNKIKIDKSFISRLENDVASRAITDAMIALGRTLDLEIVAEGVESAKVLEYISAHGCKQAQGFYLGRPMNGDSFESWYWEQGKKLSDFVPPSVRHH
ncbi:MAG TPA: EAL domain-containing protein [Noviherbaspirillum sp.]|nr:EAL domain-containing protein [Noviherbaspirillum sp.]